MERKSQQPDLDTLEREIGQLKVEFARYFAGDRDLPPLEMRDELNQRLRSLSSVPNTSTAERFRLGTLTARLRSDTDLADRRLRRHTGQSRSHARPKPTESVIAGSMRGGSAVKRLFQELYKEQTAPASLSSFQQFLEGKVSDLQDRTGCSSVQFRVVEQNGRRSLKARPLGRAK